MAPKNHFSGDFSFSTIDRLIGTLKTSFFVNSTIKTTIGSLQNRLIHHFNNNIAAIKGNMDALERLTLELQKIEPENDKQQERLEELTGRLLKTLEATRSAYEKTRFVWKKTEQVLGVLGGSYTTEDDVSG